MDMNTPDTEWWKVAVDETFCSYSHETRIAILEIIKQVISSRDTYWKERVRKEVEGMRVKKVKYETHTSYNVAIDEVLQALDNLK